jgi:hypothetical protein
VERESGEVLKRTGAVVAFGQKGKLCNGGWVGVREVRE